MYLYQKLFFAILWFLVGVFFLLWPLYFPDRPAFTIGNTGISVGWACMVLGIFNLVRWWLSRSALARRRAEAAAKDESGKSAPISTPKGQNPKI